MMFGRLGRLIHYNEPKGQALMSATTQRGRTTTANFVVDGEFENAPATISIALVKQGDRWFIQGFRVDSKFFLQ
jgi:hypothetical protein